MASKKQVAVPCTEVAHGVVEWVFLSKQAMGRKRLFESFRQTIHATLTENGVDEELEPIFRVVAKIREGEIMLHVNKRLPDNFLLDLKVVRVWRREKKTAEEQFKNEAGSSTRRLYKIPVTRKEEGSDEVADKTYVTCSWQAKLKHASPRAKTEWGGLAQRLRASREETGDVTLVARGNSIKAHRAVLAAFSPVFAAMFKHSGTKESQSGKVNISDVDMDIIRTIVLYMYEEGMDDKPGLEKLCKLLVACDKYDVALLREQCENQLSDLLSPATVSRIANTVACTPLSKELRSDTVQYLAKNLWLLIPHLKEGLSELPQELLQEAAALKNGSAKKRKMEAKEDCKDSSSEDDDDGE